MSTEQNIGVEMTVRSCEVVVSQAPANLSRAAAQHFFEEVESSMTLGRAFIVLDFSQVRQVDTDAIYLLLCCLEEAIKCDGNVKLSAVSSEARIALEANGLSGLFDSFETNTDAVSSFSRLRHSPAPSLGLAVEQLPESVSAA
jgi:anti-anti-sigma regulatory factor